MSILADFTMTLHMKHGCPFLKVANSLEIAQNTCIVTRKW